MFLKKKLKAKKTGFSESRFFIEKTVFVLKPPDKANYAAKDAVIIDDRKKVCCHLKMPVKRSLSLLIGQML